MLHAIKKFIKSLTRKKALATRSSDVVRSNRGYRKELRRQQFMEHRKTNPISIAMESLTGYERNKLMCDRKGNMQGLTVEQINSYKGKRSA